MRDEDINIILRISISFVSGMATASTKRVAVEVKTESLSKIKVDDSCFYNDTKHFFDALLRTANQLFSRSGQVVV